jgi:hypothetical protein
MKVIFFAQTPAPQGVESCTISKGRGGIEAAFHPDWENFNAIGLPSPGATRLKNSSLASTNGFFHCLGNMK